MDNSRCLAPIAGGKTILFGPRKNGNEKSGLLTGPTPPAELRTDLLVNRAERPVELERDPAEVLVLGLDGEPPAVYGDVPISASCAAPIIACHGLPIFQDRGEQATR